MLRISTTPCLPPAPCTPVDTADTPRLQAVAPDRNSKSRQTSRIATQHSHLHYETNQIEEYLSSSTWCDLHGVSSGNVKPSRLAIIPCQVSGRATSSSACSCWAIVDVNAVVGLLCFCELRGAASSVGMWSATAAERATFRYFFFNIFFGVFAISFFFSKILPR